MDLQNNATFSTNAYSFFAYLECHCSLFRRVRRITYPQSVATLLIVVSSALER